VDNSETSGFLEEMFFPAAVPGLRQMATPPSNANNLAKNSRLDVPMIN